jgi:hypothetical protein
MKITYNGTFTPITTSLRGKFDTNPNLAGSISFQESPYGVERIDLDLRFVVKDYTLEPKSPGEIQLYLPKDFLTGPQISSAAYDEVVRNDGKYELTHNPKCSVRCHHVDVKHQPDCILLSIKATKIFKCPCCDR